MENDRFSIAAKKRENADKLFLISCTYGLWIQSPLVETLLLVMNFALWFYNCLSATIRWQPQTFDTFTRLGWQAQCYAAENMSHFCLQFHSSLKFCSLPYSAAWQVVWETRILTKMNEYNPLTGSIVFLSAVALTDWQRWSFPLAPDAEYAYSAIKQLGTCAVTSWGHVVHQFDLHARHVCASMLTWFCPCCDTPAPALTIAFAYSDLHP